MSKLCIALDLETKDKNLSLARELKEFDIWLKVGLRSFIRDKKEFLYELKEINPSFKIFLDLKLYDIPNTMADSAEVIKNLPVDMFNVHASSGTRAMQSVMKRLGKNRPLVIAVTALTSFSEDEFYSIYSKSIDEKASDFAKDAFKAGLDGVVCSVYESSVIKDSTNNSFITLTPGIRPKGSDSNDQRRVATPEYAKSVGVDFIVVGRPVYKSSNPKEVVKDILNRLATK